MRAVLLENVLVRHVVVTPGKHIKNKMVVIVGPKVADRLERMIREEMRRPSSCWSPWREDRPCYTPFQRLPDGTAQLAVRSTKNNKRLGQSEADQLEGQRADIRVYLEGYSNNSNQGVRCRLINYSLR